MNYEPKEWQYKDTITAEELNRMEEGISSAQGGGTPLIVKASDNTSGTLDHTWNEIANAPSAWMEFQYSLFTMRAMITTLAQTRLEYQVHFVFPSDSEAQLVTVFKTATADGYPTSGNTTN